MLGLGRGVAILLSGILRTIRTQQSQLIIRQVALAATREKGIITQTEWEQRIKKKLKT